MMQQPKIPLLIWVAIFLQDMTNWLFGRKFVVGFGVLKGRGPAVFFEKRHGLFGRKRENLVMDVRTFLDIAEAIVKVEPSVLEQQGFTVPKKSEMDSAFTVPTWAFPKITLEVIIAAKEIMHMLKTYEKTLSTMSDILKEAGLPEEEIKKFREHAVRPMAGKEPETVASKDKPTLH